MNATSGRSAGRESENSDKSTPAEPSARASLFAQGLETDTMSECPSFLEQGAMEDIMTSQVTSLSTTAGRPEIVFFSSPRGKEAPRSACCCWEIGQHLQWWDRSEMSQLTRQQPLILLQTPPMMTSR